MFQSGKSVLQPLNVQIAFSKVLAEFLLSNVAHKGIPC